VAYHSRALSMAQEAGFTGPPSPGWAPSGSMSARRKGRLHADATVRFNEIMESAAGRLPRSEQDIRAWQTAGRGLGPTLSRKVAGKSGQPFASYLQLLSQRREAGIDPFDFSAAMPSGRGAGAVATPEAAEQARLARGGRGTGLLAAGSATGGFTGVPSGGAARGAPSRFATDARAAEQRRIGLRTAGGSESRGRGRGAKLTSALGVPGRGKTLLG